MSSETKGVAQRSPDGFLLRLIEREVESRIQLRIIGEMIDRWWHQVILHT